MAIIKENIQSDFSNLSKGTEINFVCPVCKAKKSLQFPNSVINKAKQLTTISLPKGLVCEHHFQAFVDKNFIVRGYQKVDFEFTTKKEDNRDNENQFFEDLILEGNYVEYNPRKFPIVTCLDGGPITRDNSDREIIKKIYEEFWEFIDQTNPEFKEFVEKDPRKRTPKIILS